MLKKIRHSTIGHNKIWEWSLLHIVAAELIRPPFTRMSKSIKVTTNHYIMHTSYVVCKPV